MTCPWSPKCTTQGVSSTWESSHPFFCGSMREVLCELSCAYKSLRGLFEIENQIQLTSDGPWDLAFLVSFLVMWICQWYWSANQNFDWQILEDFLNGLDLTRFNIMMCLSYNLTRHFSLPSSSAFFYSLIVPFLFTTTYFNAALRLVILLP